MRVEGITTDLVKAFRDPRGFSRLTFEASVPPIIGTYFEHDLATVEEVALLDEKLDAIEGHREFDFIFSGNSFTTTLSTDGVSVKSDVVFDEESFDFSLEQYRIILDVWSSYLALGQC